MKTIHTTRDEKFLLASGILSFFFNEATTVFKDANLNYKDLQVGDAVISASSIHRDRNWAGIGVLLRKGDENGDGWKIRSLNGRIVVWNNESFYRFPEEVQLLLREKRSR